MNYFVMQDTDYFKIELNSIILLTTPVHCKCSIYMYMYQASHKNYKHKDFLTIQLNVLNASELHVPLPEFYFIYPLSENEDFIYLLNLGGLRVIMKIRKWILYIEQKDFFLREIKLFISVITIDLDCDYNQHFIRSGNGNNDSNTLYYHVCNNDTELINVIRCKVFLDV